MIGLHYRFCIISTFDVQQWLRKIKIILFGYFGGDFLAHCHSLTIITVILFSVNHSMILIRLEAVVKNEEVYLKKPFKMNIHYSQTLAFKKYFFENHVHTLTKLSFYTGPKDVADPVYTIFIGYWILVQACVSNLIRYAHDGYATVPRKSLKYRIYFSYELQYKSHQ